MIFVIDEEEVKLNEGFTSLYFYAPWMPYHKKCMIMIEKMEEKFPQLKFLAIDTDQFKGLVTRFDVTSVPTFIVFSDGIEKKRMVGYILTSAFKSVFIDIFKAPTQKEENKNG